MNLSTIFNQFQELGHISKTLIDIIGLSNIWAMAKAQTEKSWRNPSRKVEWLAHRCTTVKQEVKSKLMILFYHVEF